MNFEGLKCCAIILNYNSAGESISLFNNLNELCFDFLEVIVIYNRSKKTDKDILKKNIPKENLIFNKKNLGYAGGNNVGIKIALEKNAQYAWILNPDIRVEKNTLPILLETIQNDEKLAAIGPRIAMREKPTTIFADGGLVKLDKICGTSLKNHNIPVEQITAKLDFDIDYLDGSCILVRCKAIKELGKLPEEYFLYFEETDWCFKAKCHNWKLAVDSRAVAYNLTSDRKDLYHYYTTRNRLIFAKKYHPHYKEVRNYYFTEILKELYGKTLGKPLKPFFLSRLKGLLSGAIEY